jgi:hypothetical protein
VVPTVDDRLIVGTGVHDEKRPAFSGQPWMAVSKLSDPKKWTSGSEQEVSDGRLRVGTPAATINPERTAARAVCRPSGISDGLGDVALRMTAGAGYGFATVFDGVPAEIAAINFAAADRPDDRAVTGIVAAFNRSFLHGLRARGWLDGVVCDFHADNLG